ncbi:uncharacterized protein LOC120084079 [Benincasa hispida]|uniref:uncharacterized protein LOC120084079 n=1 Tax=Benincasa hispida TaxID=102211 RepID=UPI00190254DE|nr:uncharacterized protein LOC120084079 [Benincasa hispida]
MTFAVCGKVVTFSKDDFLVMTGLWQSPSRIDRNQQSSYELAIKYFGNRVKKDTLHLRELKEKYKDLEFENDDDAVKISLVYYTEVAMMGKNKQKNAVDLKRFKDVQSLEYYNSIDWGTIIWERTLDALKTALNDKSSLYKTRVKSNKNYAVITFLRGFPQAFPGMDDPSFIDSWEHCGAKEQFALPRINRWSTMRGGSPESESDGEDHRGDANDEVVKVEGGDNLDHSEHRGG